MTWVGVWVQAQTPAKYIELISYTFKIKLNE